MLKLERASKKPWTSKADKKVSPPNKLSDEKKKALKQTALLVQKNEKFSSTKQRQKYAKTAKTARKMEVTTAEQTRWDVQ